MHHWYIFDDVLRSKIKFKAKHDMAWAFSFTREILLKWKGILGRVIWAR